MLASIDPGRRTGLAIYVGGPSPAVSTFDDPTMADRRRLLTWAANMATERGERLAVVIEDQHAEIRWVVDKRTGRKNATIDFPGIASVVRNAERWVVAAEDVGADVHRVLGTVWQGPSLACVPATADGKKLTTKQRARLAVSAAWQSVYRFTGVPDPDALKLTPVSRLNEHERDAMLLGRWWLGHGERWLASRKAG